MAPARSKSKPAKLGVGWLIDLFRIADGGDEANLSWSRRMTATARATRHDPLTPAERSELMARVRSVDTKPEMLVRRLVHRLGYRYRLHDRSIPGSPDLVFKGKKKVIFVNGCFWHRHRCANGRRIPKSRVAFWTTKFEENVKRDRRVERALRRAGWRILLVWECQARKPQFAALVRRIERFLHSH